MPHSWRQKWDAAVGPTKCGKGMKLGMVVERGGIPLATETDAANVSEVVLGPAVFGVPVLAERTFAWVQTFRRVATRYEYKVGLYDGFVSLVCAFIALSKL